MITKPIMLHRLDPEMCNQTSINNQSHKQCYGTGYCISCTRTCINKCWYVVLTDQKKCSTP